MELLEYLRENRFVRQKSWGFFFGFLGGAGSARSFERSEIFEQVRSDGHKRQTYTGLRGYEVKGKKKDTWSGWRYSGELAAAMPGFERSPSTRDYKYALELCFEWHKPLSEKLREEVADAAVLWQAVNDPAVVLKALEPLGTKSPKIELQGLSALARAIEPAGLVPVEDEDPESLKRLFDDLNEGWGGCLQIRTFGRYLIEAANRVVGVPALIESSLAIEHGGVVRLMGGPLGAK